jgi:DNA-binding LytR/AlgR family response regulator
MANDNYLIIANQDELIRVSPGRIVYIVSDGNYSTLVLTNAEERVFTINLSAFQKLIEAQLKAEAHQFIRVGKSLIINRYYIYYISPSKQQIILSDKSFQNRFELLASKEALKQLKTVIESTLKSISV